MELVYYAFHIFLINFFFHSFPQQKQRPKMKPKKQAAEKKHTRAESSF